MDHCGNLATAAAAREVIHAFPAQRALFHELQSRLLVEQLTLNQRVPGSSPGAPTKPNQVLSLNGFH